MTRALHVARRELVATVATKGFVIGVLITPAILALVFLALPALIQEEAPRIEGEIAILDPTGAVAPRVRELLAPEELARRRSDQLERLEAGVPEALPALAGRDGLAAEALAAALGEVPRLAVTELAATADQEAEKEPLRQGGILDGGRLALVVVAADAVRPPSPEAPFGAYELYVRHRLDDRLESEVRSAVDAAIVDARLSAAGLEGQRIKELTRVARAGSTTVAPEGERATNEIANIFLPMGFMLLLLLSVLIGGQSLMTTTVEEKSNRVVEVLLSAVSPMELMTGKILGQMAVGLLVLGFYAALGASALVSFALLGLLDPLLLLYLVLFYLLAYFTVGSLMAAIGAAVNELREAQSLMAPITMALMVPWVLWLPLTRDPNSTFATVASFLPPINTFAMLLRVTSTSPPPAWQVWLSMAVGGAGAWVAVILAAKVFRIGLLMHGKPPSFGTLLRWVRSG